MNNKKLSKVLLIAITLFILLPITKTKAEEFYGIRIAGIDITSSNNEDVFDDGTVSYDPNTSTLTLNNANIEYVPPTSSDKYKFAVIELYNIATDLNIVLIGKNTLSINTTVDNLKQEISGESAYYSDVEGIASVGFNNNLNITGQEGLLQINVNVEGYHEDVKGLRVYGIDNNKKIIIEKTQIDMNLSSDYEIYAFESEHLELIDSNINVSIDGLNKKHRKEDTIAAIYATESTNMDNSNIKINIVDNNNFYYVYGVATKTLNIHKTNIDVSMAINAYEDGSCYGIFGYDIKVDGSFVTANVTGADKGNYGIYSIENLQLDESTVIANARSVSGVDSSKSYGVYIEDTIKMDDSSILEVSGETSGIDARSIEHDNLTALVNDKGLTSNGASKWEGSTSFLFYKYTRIPFLYTVNIEFGEGNEDLVERYFEASGYYYNGSKVIVYVSDEDYDYVGELWYDCEDFLNDEIGFGKPTKSGNKFSNGWVGLKPGYSSWDEFYADDEESWEKEIDGDVTFYILWFDPVSKADFTMNPLKCGDEFVVSDGAFDDIQEPSLLINVDGQAEIEIDEDNNKPYTELTDIKDIKADPFNGIIDYDKTYYVVANIRPSFGYIFVIDEQDPNYIGNVLKFNDSKVLDHDKKLIFAEFLAQASVEHDWGEWEIIQEPSETKAGLKQRVCKGNHEHKETQEIPAKGYEITFDIGDATLDGKTGIITYYYQIGDEIIMPKPEKDGYTFKYWQGSIYYAGDKYKVTGNHKFVAVWSNNNPDYIIPKTGIE